MAPIKEEVNETSAFGSDFWLREGVEMEEFESKPPCAKRLKTDPDVKWLGKLKEEESIRESVKEETVFSAIFSSDVWLRDSFKLKEEDRKEVSTLTEMKTESDEGQLDAEMSRSEGETVNVKKRKWMETGEKKDNNNVTWREMFPHATVSEKVENLCEYRCPTCIKEFIPRQSLRVNSVVAPPFAPFLPKRGEY